MNRRLRAVGLCGALVPVSVNATLQLPAGPDGPVSDWVRQGAKAVEAGDCARGVALIERARRFGELSAYIVLGNLHENGDCVERDLKRAFGIYRDAEALNKGVEAALVGYMYLHGRGVGQDRELARHWFRKTALRTIRQSADERLWSAGVYLQHRGIPDELRVELDWVTSVEAGDAGRLYTLAMRILGGDGFPRELDAAHDWMWLAARKDLPEAQHALGLAYFDGVFGAPNPSSGFGELHRAAKADFVPAQVEMARRYAEGDGMDRVPINAYFWYRRAQQNGADVSAAIDGVVPKLAEFHREIAEEWLERWPDGPTP